MKNVFFFLVVISALLTSCTPDCEKNLQGKIIDKTSKEPLANVVVKAWGAEETSTLAGTGRQFYEQDIVITDENGEFTISTNEDINLWEYTLELDGYVGSNEFFKGIIYDVPCGNQPVELSMQSFSFVDLKVNDDTQQAGVKVTYYTEFPTIENVGILGLGETARIPVLSDETFEIKLTVYDVQDELLREETINVEVAKGEIESIEFTM